MEIFMQHIALAKTNGQVFRKTVMTQIMSDIGCSNASAATRYNDVLKLMRVNEPDLVEGLGRQPRSGVHQTSDQPRATRARATDPDDDDEDCEAVFTVLEVITRGGREWVGRTQCFIMQGDASECFDSRVSGWPGSGWVLISGMGPMHGEPFRLRYTDRLIKRHAPGVAATVSEFQFRVAEQLVTVQAECASEARAMIELSNPGIDVYMEA